MKPFATLVFLLLDHIGGINTLFYTLSNGGTIVLARDRSAASVCEAIEAARVELLPTSPTFLNLLLLGRAWERYDLSSLRRITYGTEVMPEHTLRLANEALGFSTTADVTVTPGRAATLDVPVPDGVLHVNASPWATITIDGQSYGETPLGNLRLPLGSHEVVFQHPDFGERRETVIVTSSTPARISVDFRK